MSKIGPKIEYAFYLFISVLAGFFIIAKLTLGDVLKKNESPTLAYRCDSTYDDIAFHCRKGIVDGQYEVWKANRAFIKQMCDYMAHEITCEPIKER